MACPHDAEFTGFTLRRRRETTACELFGRTQAVFGGNEVVSRDLQSRITFPLYDEKGPFGILDDAGGRRGQFSLGGDLGGPRLFDRDQLLANAIFEHRRVESHHFLTQRAPAFRLV